MRECAGPGQAVGTVWRPSRGSRVYHRPLVVEGGGQVVMARAGTAGIRWMLE